jgi:hypothetical protein
LVDKFKQQGHVQMVTVGSASRMGSVSQQFLLRQQCEEHQSVRLLSALESTLKIVKSFWEKRKNDAAIPNLGVGCKLGNRATMVIHQQLGSIIEPGREAEDDSPTRLLSHQGRKGLRSFVCARLRFLGFLFGWQPGHRIRTRLEDSQSCSVLVSHEMIARLRMQRMS